MFRLKSLGMRVEAGLIERLQKVWVFRVKTSAQVQAAESLTGTIGLVSLGVILTCTIV